MPSWNFSKPRIPARAVILSAAALVAPLAASPSVADPALTYLIWLLPLIPAFLLAYYRGWRGVAASLAAAMAALALSNMILVLRGGELNELILVTLLSMYIATSLGTGWLSEALHGARARAELAALTDELTRMPNRRHLRMFLERQLSAGRRSSITVVLFDLDHFKLYNDRHGHAAGDVMLCTFADALTSNRPVGAMAGRYGGEEFLVVLPDADEGAGVELAHRVSRSLASAQQSADPLTVCAGVASGGVGVATTNELIVAADRALYRAKQSGRDCVCSASEMIAAAS